MTPEQALIDMICICNKPGVDTLERPIYDAVVKFAKEKGLIP